MDFRFHGAYIVIAAALLLGAVPQTAKSQTMEERLQRGDAVVRSGARQPHTPTRRRRGIRSHG
ncbi:hypothetical protein [Mesorhizobium sp.]|uniref:hypothetical protein n=1 Tax=Mesorhizobium sp. TaxID=1871066 RepID=UPI00351AA9F6